jgi:hypothetical protein
MIPRSPGHFTTRAWPTTVVWRFRYEILGFATLGALMISMVDRLGVAPASAILFLCLSGGASIPPVRRVVVLAFWHVAVPHRIRSVCVTFGVLTAKGRVPAILRTRTRATGHDVTIWCRVGTSWADFPDLRRHLADACWADDVEVRPHRWRRRHLPLMILHISRDEYLTDRQADGADRVSRRPEPGSDAGQVARVGAVPRQSAAPAPLLPDGSSS